MLNTRIGYLALFSALFISSVAIFFSVAGLAAIFSAYAISIIVMGASIELGKLVAIVWLHHNWRDKNKILKGGLSFFVIGVMFITSMGIFGYLSKSHVEQTAQSQESVAQVQRIETELARYSATIARSEQKIEGYETSGSGVDASLNSQIDKEQARIDSAYDRVKPVIQVQLDIIANAEVKIENRTKPYQTELDAITQQLADLQTALSNKEIRTAQGIVGTRPDGSYKEKTQKAIRDFRTRNEARRELLLQKIDAIRGTPSVASKSAQEEITRIRASVQSEINESNATINKLRGRMGKTNVNDIETLITTEQNKIKASNTELDVLTEEKYTLQANYRKLEAEVGPIKHIAEFVYGQEANANLLEKAVRWLIIIIIFVFDPFAVFLLIAAQHSFDRARKEREAGKEPEYTMEELLNDYEPEPLSDEDKEWVNAPLVEEEFGAEEEVNHNHEWGEIPVYEDYFPDEEVDDADIHSVGNIALTRVDKNYINYNGKVYRIPALIAAKPELNLDFDRPVRSGEILPAHVHEGSMFLRFDVPTELFMFNGNTWNKIDKNVLNFGAYSHEYIKALIKRVGNGEYDTTLLNEAEKKHFEDLLGKK